MGNLPVKRHEGEGLLGGEAISPLRLMRRLLGWDPFREMTPYIPGEEPGLTFVPAFEIKETKDAYEFRGDVPGLTESDVDITITGNRLSVSGSREAETEERTDRFFATERTYGSFVRSFTLPEGIDPGNINASLANGVLTIVVPKKPETQPKKIPVAGAREKRAEPKQEPARAEGAPQAQATQPTGATSGPSKQPQQSARPQQAPEGGKR